MGKPVTNSTIRQCANCTTAVDTTGGYWARTKQGRDELVFCSNACYNHGECRLASGVTIENYRTDRDNDRAGAVREAKA